MKNGKWWRDACRNRVPATAGTIKRCLTHGVVNRYVFLLVRYLFFSLHSIFYIKRNKNRLLFVQFDSALGWAINETPVFESLKKSMPDCHITIICGKIVHEVIKNNPFVDTVILLANPHDRFLNVLYQMIRITFFKSYDVVLTTAFNRQPRRVVLALLSGARRCVGFSDIDGLYDKFVKYDASRSVTQNNLNALSTLGIIGVNYKPRVYFTADDYSRASTLIGNNKINGSLPVCIFVTQTSGGQPSDWWPERFAQLADYLCRTSRLQIVFIGSRADIAGIEKIRKLMIEPSVSIAGMTDISTLAAVMCISDIAVTLDTGPMHIGTAVDLPMVLIASAWQSPHEWLPLDNKKVTILRSNEIACKECYKYFCSTRECMEDISVRDVYSNVTRMLVAYPPSASARLQRVRDSIVSGHEPKTA